MMTVSVVVLTGLKKWSAELVDLNMEWTDCKDG